MSNMQGLEITGAPQARRTGPNQLYGPDYDQGLREHAQGDEVKSSTLMKTSDFILTTLSAHHQKAPRKRRGEEFMEMTSWN